MEQVHKIELALVEQYNKIPHLPEGVRTWLAKNAWWLVLIGVVVSAIGLLITLLGFAIVALGLSIGGAALYGVPGGAAGVAVGGVVLIVTVLSLALSIVVTILMAMAITPLRTLKKSGWDLLFIVSLVNVAFAIITGVLSLQIVSLIWGLLWAAVGAYFLFEVRDYFVVKKVHAKPVDAKVKAKA